MHYYYYITAKEDTEIDDANKKYSKTSHFSFSTPPPLLPTSNNTPEILRPSLLEETATAQTKSEKHPDRHIPHHLQ